jgi:hypothetical protein
LRIGKPSGGEVEIFDHNKKHWLSINGKQFYLIQGYSQTIKYQSQPIFLQVYGRVSLRYEDLPDKEWTIVKTLIPGRTKGKKKQREYIYTAFYNPCFDYETPWEKPRKAKTFFIGRTKEGSAYLAVTTIARLYGIQAREEDFQRVAKEVILKDLIAGFDMEEDEGNSGVTAISLDGMDNNHRYKQFSNLLTPKEKNGRKKK